MAILSFYKCQILVNGIAVQEYEDDIETTPDQLVPTAVKYIEAVSGAHFSIEFSLLMEGVPKDNLAVKIYLDGNASWNMFVDVSEADLRKNCWRLDGVTVGSDGNWFLKKYQFANIVTGLLRAFFSSH